MTRTRDARIAGLLAALLLAPARARDWTRHPAVLELRDVTRVVATSDIHGALPQIVATLKRARLVREDDAAPCGVRWVGRDAVWISTGDFGDRGDHTREVYELLGCLEPRAAAAGGRVVALIGNHEVMLLDGEVARRARGGDPSRREGYRKTIESLTATGASLEEAIGPAGLAGAAIRRMPLMAVVNDRVGFLHAGLGRPLSRRTLSRRYRRAVDAEDWGDPFLSPRTDAQAAASPVWARNWWNHPDRVTRTLRALGVERLVFGHSTAALFEEVSGEEPELGQILTDGRLFKIDTGMCPAYGYSQGAALEIRFGADGTTYTALYPGHRAVVLHRDPPSPARRRPQGKVSGAR